MWKSGTMLALCAVLLAACRANVKDHNGDGVITVLCVGDSNTDTGGKADSPKWCEFVAQQHTHWKFVENAATVSERIDAANALLAQHVAPARLVDFFSDMRREDFYPDGLHINASGQHKRAVAVEKALKNL